MAQTIDKQMLAALKFSGLDKKNLLDISSIISRLSGSGLKIEKVFPYGIPVVDGVRVQSSLPGAQLGRLVDILRAGRRLDDLKIFPKGIPVPDVFHVEIGIR